MHTSRLQRILPLSGVLFTLIMVTALVLTRGEADSSGPVDKIFAYWHGHYGAQMISALVLAPLAALLLVIFAAELRRTIRSGEAGEAIYSPIILAGGVMTAVGLGVTGAFDAAVTSAAHHNSHAAVYTLAQLQSYDWVPWILGFATMMLAVGVGGLRTATLPKSLSWPALVLGIAFLTPLGFFGLFVLPVWTLAAGVVLYRRNTRTRAAGIVPAPQPA
jgi:hypothetical protein